MKTSLRPALGLAIMLVLAACGHPDPARPPQAPRALAPTPAPAILPAPAIDPATQQLVAAAIRRLDALRTIQGKVRFEEWEGDQQDVGEAEITFRQRPFAARVDVLSSNRLLASGTTILWEGGTQLKIRPVKLPITLKFSYDSAHVVSLRGYRMDQTDLFSMGKVLRHPGAQIRPVGPRRVRGEDLFLVEVRSPGSVPGVSRELIGLHQRHQIPAYREMYEGDRLVHRGQGLNLRFDRAIDDDRFDL